MNKSQTKRNPKNRRTVERRQETVPAEVERRAQKERRIRPDRRQK